MQIKEISQERVPALDGLRAIAVALVILRHIGRPVVPGGFLGVDLFFTLSGYLITSILLEEHKKYGSISLRHFYLRRSVRIMPALWLLLLAALLARNLVVSHLFSLREILFAGTYTMNWTRAFHFGGISLLGHTWSLAIEEQFYLLWPPLLLLLLSWKPKLAPLAAILLGISSMAWSTALQLNGATWERIYNGFDTRAVELLVGCAAAFLPLDSRFGNLLTKLWAIPVLGFVLALHLTEGAAFLSFGGYGMLGLMAAWIIIAIRRGKSWPVRTLARPATAYVGRISYGIYLWHLPLLGVCAALGFNSLMGPLIALPLTVLVAAFSFHFVERPLLALTQNRFRPAQTRGLSLAEAETREKA